MKFFIPDKSPEDGEKLYESIRKFVRKSFTGVISDARIHSITYPHEGKTVQETVGRWDPFERRVVIAILDAGDDYLVFERGRLSDPIPVAKKEVSHVELFDSGDKIRQEELRHSDGSPATQKSRSSLK